MSKDYDRSIHHNTSADAWAKFFMETWKERNYDPAFVEHDLMRGWFANAMMAMHDGKISAEREALQKILKLAKESEDDAPTWLQTHPEIVELAEKALLVP